MLPSSCPCPIFLPDHVLLGAVEVFSCPPSDDVLLGAVEVFSFALCRVESTLYSLIYVITIYLLWKFRNRLLQSLGLGNNFSQVFGDARDWFTCWGMQRFEPIEIYFLKIEGAPNSKDVFLDVRVIFKFGAASRGASRPLSWWKLHNSKLMRKRTVVCASVWNCLSIYHSSAGELHKVGTNRKNS